MFDAIGRIVVFWIGGAIAFSPTYIALLVAGSPNYAAFIVGCISAFAGAFGYVIIKGTQRS